jgi:predicted dehydrogenase
MAEMIQTALVGCAHIHTPGFLKKLKERSDIAVKLVWDHDAGRAEVNAGELKAQTTGSLEKVWQDPQIQAVVICSETDRHEPLVLAAAEAKKHMFVEKPLGMGAADGYRMAEAIDSAGVLFQTGYFMRSNPINLFLREQVRKGSFGKITRVRGSNCHGGALGGWFDAKPQDRAHDWRWMADPKVAGVGAFGDLGTHSLDILIWLMGDVELATAQIDNGTARYEGCDETGEGLMRFRNGVIGTLAAGWDDVANPVSLLISGTEGHAAVINGQLHFQSKHVEGADGKSPWTALPPGLPHAFDLFLDAVTGKKDLPLVGAREAAYRSAVMEAMYEGAKTGSWVRPK